VCENSTDSCRVVKKYRHGIALKSLQEKLVMLATTVMVFAIQTADIETYVYHTDVDFKRQ